MRRLFWLGCLLASAAWADVPPADVDGCRGKAVGDACDLDDGTAGFCRQETCGRLDYSQGVPPKSVEYDCVRCVASPTTPTPSTEAPRPKEKSSCAATDAGALVLLTALLRRRRA